MPELPEVQTIRKQLAKEVIGKKIIDVSYDTPKMLRPGAEIFEKQVKNKKITQIERRAKMLFIKLDNVYIAVHLKLNGRLLHRKSDDPVGLYTHVTLKFDDKTELRFADSRKFGFMQLLEPKDKEKIVSAYGFEPLDDLSLDQFTEILSKSKRKVKDVLMDQKLIAGVGNIYANDSLWLAKIHPETIASHLSKDEIKNLFNALESVLKESLIDGGASDNWYRQLHGEKGKYQEHFKIYGKTNQDCKLHPSVKIEYKKVSQRGSFICPKCQTKK